MRNLKMSALPLLLAAVCFSALVFLTAGGPYPQIAHAQAPITEPDNIFVNSVCKSDDNNPIGLYIRFGNETSHYYQFLGKRNSWYTIATDIVSSGESITIDTKILLYANNPLTNVNEQPIAQNDDGSSASGESPADAYESSLTFQASEDKYYWVEVQNLVSQGRGLYCIQVEQSDANPEAGAVAPDQCEFNNTIETACEVEIVAQRPTVTPDEGEPATLPAATPSPIQFDPGSYPYNFYITSDGEVDLDFYKLWVKEGWSYSCETYNLSAGNDTNMIFYDQHGGDFYPNLGNDDIAIGNKASKVSITAPYTGWLHILVNPHVEVDYRYGARYNYRLKCVYIAATPIPEGKTITGVQDTGNANQNTGGQVVTGAVPTPVPENNVVAEGVSTAAEQVVITAADPPAVAAVATPVPAAIANNSTQVTFVRVPQATAPAAAPPEVDTFTIQIYYDQNENNLKDEAEGVVDIPVYIFTELSNTPLKAQTTATGAVFVQTATVNGRVHLVVPYLNLSRELAVTDVQDIRLRVAPRP